MNSILAWSTTALVLGIAFAQAARAEDIKFGELSSALPGTWKSVKLGPLRSHQYSVPGADGKEDVDVSIFHFPGGGGGLKANLERWKGMFKAPAGKSIDDVSKLDTIKLDKVTLTYFDISGTYLQRTPPADPNGKITEKPEYRMISVYFDCDGGPYFIRLTDTGAATVERHKAEFDKWLKNFK